MTTKIFVTQIDVTNADGTTAPQGSFIYIGSAGPYWANSSILGGGGGGGGTGFTGSVGATGFTGSASAGFTGSEGEIGEQGQDGFTGSVGFVGSRGPIGYTGSPGTGGGGTGGAGFTGSVGDSGFTGSIGDTGFQGSVGFQGSQGIDGYQGSAGELGPTGFQGSAGDPGVLIGTLRFVDLQDAPDGGGVYNNNAYVKVNAGGDGLEYDDSVFLTSEITANVDFNGNLLINPVLKGYGEEVFTYETTVNIDMVPANQNVYIATLDNAVVGIVPTYTGMIPGKLYSVTFFLKQDATGGRTIDWSNLNLTWPSSEGISAPDGPLLSTTPNHVDVINIVGVYDGTTGMQWYGTLSAKGFPVA